MSEREENSRAKMKDGSNDTSVAKQTPDNRTRAVGQFSYSFVRSPAKLLSIFLSIVLIALGLVAWKWPAYRFLAILFGSSLLAILTFWMLPKWQVTHLTADPSGAFENENEARKTLAQIIGDVAPL